MNQTNKPCCWGVLELHFYYSRYHIDIIYTYFAVIPEMQLPHACDNDM